VDVAHLTKRQYRAGWVLDSPVGLKCKLSIQLKYALAFLVWAGLIYAAFVWRHP
jgi:hypothetical protein